jgi:uncharacterized membrane protein
MLPLSKNPYFEVLKDLDKKFYMYIFIIYVCFVKFHENQYFLWSNFLKKFILWKELFLALFFVFYTRYMISWFFIKRLCERVAREDIF